MQPEASPWARGASIHCQVTPEATEEPLTEPPDCSSLPEVAKGPLGSDLSERAWPRQGALWTIPVNAAGERKGGSLEPMCLLAVSEPHLLSLEPYVLG